MTEELFTKGEWTPVFGRHKEGTPIFGYGVKAPGKLAYLCNQGIYEHHVGIGSWDGKPVEGLYTPEEGEANAHLLAASKDLYFALKELMEYSGSHVYPPSLYDKAMESLYKANPNYKK